MENAVRDISDDEWKIIKNAEPDIYAAAAMQVSHMLARIMLDFQRKGEGGEACPSNIAEDLDTLLLTAINVFRRNEREEVSDFYYCADRLAAIGLKLESCGRMMQDYIGFLNEVRPKSFAMPDWHFDEKEWEVFSSNKEYSDGSVEW